jgi:hypothetical protein
MISARFLARYTCAALALTYLLMLLATVAPGAESHFAVLQRSVGGSAVFFAVAGLVLGCLPGEQWVSKSPGLRRVLIAAAVLATLAFLVLGAG